jgi:hypothetical protein
MRKTAIETSTMVNSSKRMRLIINLATMKKRLRVQGIRHKEVLTFADSP